MHMKMNSIPKALLGEFRKNNKTIKLLRGYFCVSSVVLEVLLKYISFVTLNNIFQEFLVIHKL